MRYQNLISNTTKYIHTQLTSHYLSSLCTLSSVIPFEVFCGFFFFSQHSCLGFEYLIIGILHTCITVSAFCLVSPEFTFYSVLTPEALLCWSSNFKSLWPLCKLNWKGRRVCCGVWSGVFHHLTNPLTRDSLGLRVIGSSCSFLDLNSCALQLSWKGSSNYHNINNQLALTKRDHSWEVVLQAT